MKKILFMLISLQLFFSHCYFNMATANTHTKEEIKQKLLSGEAYIPYDKQEEKQIHAIIKSLKKKDQQTIATQYLFAARYYLEKSTLSSTRASTIKGYQKTAYISASLALPYFQQGTEMFAETKQILIKYEPKKLP